MLAACRPPGIVIIGDEILSGKFAEENAAFLIGELRALGVDLRRITVVPDELDDIAATVVATVSRVSTTCSPPAASARPTTTSRWPRSRTAFGTTVVRHPELERGSAATGRTSSPTPTCASPTSPTAPSSSTARTRSGRWSAAATSTSCPACRRCSVASSSTSAIGSAPSPVTAARLYVDVDEGELAPHLDAIVSASRGEGRQLPAVLRAGLQGARHARRPEAATRSPRRSKRSRQRIGERVIRARPQRPTPSRLSAEAEPSASR